LVRVADSAAAVALVQSKMLLKGTVSIDSEASLDAIKEYDVKLGQVFVLAEFK
jgi:hypothetical protein